ncbi:RGG repeats nuclear RNA binding protein A-like [Typha latifolia]|uniref:RGG repeats nuclear RNA binding protein A-like n=1 Tax=Typha latifolia TaxID=4733 RepID=UPI003C2DFA7C
MATKNPFDLLGDDDSDDLSHLVAAQQHKTEKKPASAAAAPPAVAKLPAKPVPPTQAVKEARGNTAPTRGGASRGGFGRGGRGQGGGAGQRRDFGNGSGRFSGGYGGGGGGGIGGEDGDANRPLERDRAPRQPYRGGRRGGYGSGETGGDSEGPPRRMYERRSGTGRGYEMKREGSGRGNWGTATDDTLLQETEETINVEEKVVVSEKQKEQEDVPTPEITKEGIANEAGEKEPEDKEMTLDEYEKIREEKRKALLALKSEERKVEIDKELQSMQQLSLKKGNEEVFVKLGSDKDSMKKKENAERDERVKKSLSINEFLKPAGGERSYGPGGRGRGRGRGRGEQGAFGGSFGGSTRGLTAAPSIEDQQQFPTLGGK